DAGAPLYPNVLATAPPPSTAKPNIIFFDPNFQNPLIHQADLVVEREIGWRTDVSGSYLLSLGRHLANFADLNLNRPSTTISYSVNGGPLNGQTITVPLFTGPRPNPNFSGITDIVANINSSYNALVLQLNKRLSQGLQFQNSYTWSHAIDFNQNSTTFTDFNDMFDPFNARADRGSSRFDIRHRFVSSIVWQPTMKVS